MDSINKITRSNKRLLIIHTEMKTVAVGVYHLQAYLKTNRIICDIHIYDELTSLISQINKQKPTMLAFSVHWHPQLVPSLKLADILKNAYPNIPILFGGLTASYFYQDLIKYHTVDYIICGDGEQPLLDLLNEQSKVLIPNLCWKDETGNPVYNPVTYVSGAEQIADFIYHNSKDFHSTRSVIKLGKGCHGNCFHCGGRSGGLLHLDCNSVVSLTPEQIARVITRNYEAIKFKSFYLAQDHARDLSVITRGLLMVNPAISGKLSVTIDAWGLPRPELITEVCASYHKVRLEITLDTLNTDLLNQSRGIILPRDNYIYDYLKSLLINHNLIVHLYFSYPHIINERLLIPDYQTLEAIVNISHFFAHELAQEQLTVRYLPLSTDPGSKYAERFSFAEYFQALIHSKTNDGSFTIHHRGLLSDEVYAQHHLLQQIIMNILSKTPLLFQYLYQVKYKKNMEACYQALQDTLKESLAKHIAFDRTFVAPYQRGTSYLGYSDYAQEETGPEKLNYYTGHFLLALYSKLALPDLFKDHLGRFQDQAVIDQAKYHALFQPFRRSENNRHLPQYPMLNPFVNIVTYDYNPYYDLINALIQSDPDYQYLSYQLSYYKLCEYPLMELKILLNIHLPDYYTMLKIYNIEQAANYELLRSKAVSAGINSGIPVDHEPQIKVTYCYTAVKQLVIPLTSEELNILNLCDGQHDMESIKSTIVKSAQIDITYFNMIYAFFFDQGIIG